MLRILFFLFVVLPIIEIWVLIQVGGLVGAPMTIALILGTAAAGAVLLRQQGLGTLLRIQQRLQQGEMPAQEIVEGVMLAVGGALLLTPGFVTDTIGFCCLIPGIRQVVIAKGLVKLVRRVAKNATVNHSAHYQGHGSFSHSNADRAPENQDQSKKGSVIDGEFRRDE